MQPREDARGKSQLPCFTRSHGLAFLVRHSPLTGRRDQMRPCLAANNTKNQKQSIPTNCAAPSMTVERLDVGPRADHTPTSLIESLLYTLLPLVDCVTFAPTTRDVADAKKDIDVLHLQTKQKTGIKKTTRNNTVERRPRFTSGPS